MEDGEERVQPRAHDNDMVIFKSVVLSYVGKKVFD